MCRAVPYSNYIAVAVGVWIILLPSPPLKQAEKVLWRSASVCVCVWGCVCVCAITQRASPYYVLLWLFFFFFFSARSPRSLGRSPGNLATWSEMGAILKTRSKIWGPPHPPPPKKWGRKHAFWCDFGRLHTQFDRECLRKGTRHRQSENGVANYDLSCICWRNLGTLVHKRRKIGP